MPNPDDLLRPGSTSFIYSDNGHLWTAAYDDPHFLQYSKEWMRNTGVSHAMMLIDPEVGEDVFGSPLDMDQLDEYDFWGIRDEIEADAIIGRVDAYGQQIAIWNNLYKHPAVFDLLEPCLQELLDRGLIEPEAELYAPAQDDPWEIGDPVAGILGLEVPSEVADFASWHDSNVAQPSPEAARKIELAKRMHLARGAEKQAIMKQLNVWDGRGKEHPWAHSLKQIGLLGPGQKWRTPHSESVQLREGGRERADDEPFDWGIRSPEEFEDEPLVVGSTEDAEERNPFDDVEFADPDAEPDPGSETARAREIWMDRNVPDYSSIKAHNYARELPQFAVSADYLVDSGRRIWSHSTFSDRKTGMIYVDPEPNRYHGEFSEYCEDQGWPVGYYVHRDDKDPYDVDMKGRIGLLNSPQGDQAIVVSFYNVTTLAEVMTALRQLLPKVGSEAFYSDIRRKVLFKVGDMIKTARSRPHPLDTAMRQRGLTVPGQRWWAQHSESRLFETRLNIILEQVEAEHTYGCLMATITGKLSAKITRWCRHYLPDDWIYEEDDDYGREDHHHITVVYGFDDADAAAVKEFVRIEEPVAVSLGNVSKFAGDTYDVIKIDVHSPMLTALHKRLVMEFHPTLTHPTYRPHITIAYVRKGVADDLLRGEDAGAFAGTALTIGDFVFSDTSGGVEDISVVDGD